MKTLITLSIIIISIFPIFGQEGWKEKLIFEEKFDLSYQYMATAKYHKALPILLEIDSLYPNNSNIKYKIGVCYMNSLNNKLLAIPYLEKAILNVSDKYKPDYYKETSVSPKVYLHLAKAYHLSHQFEKAINNFENYKLYITGKNSDLLNEVNRLIQISYNAKELVENPINVVFNNLSDSINSEYSEYAPVISADRTVLIFTSRRANTTGGEKTALGEYYEDIYISYKKGNSWSKAQKIDINVNSNYHDASLSLSADGTQLYIYKYDGKSGDIYVSNLVGEKWQTPIKVEAISKSSARETHACITPDGKAIYFSSERSGGYGGKDIYMSKKLPTGKWSSPINLGAAINTPHDESIPYIHVDGKTLYFCSNGHSTMGGYDIFISKYKEAQWSTPENIGYPINTTDNDYFFVPTADGKHAYYATANQKDSKGKFDIYYVDFPEEEEVPLRIIVGKLKLENSDSIPKARIEVFEKNTKKLVGIYKPNKKSGKFIIILENGKNYDVSYFSDGCYIKNDEILVPNDSSFNEIKINVALKQFNIKDTLTFDNLTYDLERKTIKNTEVISEIVNLINKNNIKVKLTLTQESDKKSSNISNITTEVLNQLINAGADKSKIEKVSSGIKVATISSDSKLKILLSVTEIIK